MNLEDSVKDVITKKLEDGTVERIISEKLEKGNNSCLYHLAKPLHEKVMKMITD